MRCLLAICVILATVTASTSKTSTTASAATATTSTPPPTRTIPPGYTYNAATESYYKVHESWGSWDVANTTCASEGARLVVVNDAEEADIVALIVYGAGQYSTWTGLRDNRPGGVMEWRTVLGEPLSDVFHEWRHGGARNNARNTCAAFDVFNKLLYGRPCNESHFITCEMSR